MKLIAILMVLCACGSSAVPTSTPATPRVSDCEQAINERNIAIQTEVDVCAKLGGPKSDPTGACQRLIDAGRDAQLHSACVCMGNCTGQP
jgi:hypothetical protein